MNANETLAVVTSTWGVLMAASPGLQIRQMRQTGTSEDVSVAYFGVLTIGFVLWTAYGMSIGSQVLVVCNIVAAVFGVTTILVALRLRRAAPEPVEIN